MSEYDDFPSKNMNRAFRRKKLSERKQFASDVASRFGIAETWAVKNANNLKPCSCRMCGNPRRHYGDKTRQEQKNDVGSSPI